MKKILRIISALILLVVGVYVVLFSMDNKHMVEVNPVISESVQTTLSLAMLSSFFIGVLLMSLFAFAFLVKGSFQKRKVVKELKKTNKELEKVRAERDTSEV